MQIERFQWKETSRIVEMICQVWKSDRMFKSLKNGMIFSQEYFYDVLLHSTDLFIATKQQRIVGFLALSLSKKEKILIPEEYQNLLYHQHDDFHLISSYRQMMQNYHQNCEQLLPKMHQNYDGEIVLFMVDETYQHQGLGTKLYEYAEYLLKKENCSHYILYTDTSCSYEFYDHHQMKRLDQYRRADDFTIYLYAKELKSMEYRQLPHGYEKISVIGLGTSSLGESSDEEIIATIQEAIDQGVNYLDLASGHAKTFQAIGQAIKGQREKVYLQIHFGANYETGEYGWTTNLDKIKQSIQWQLEMLQTDYIDFGFIHCIDEEADLKAIEKAGVIDYIQELKKQGIVKHIGLSSHTPEIVHKVLDMHILDMVMFSINPAYDYKHGEYAIGQTDERMALYQRCEKEGVAISVMKAFSAGQLLDANKSPFSQALTRIQCLQYALDKPGVVTVLPGVRNRDDLKEILKYTQASDKDKDYTVISTFDAVEHQGKCVYCKHCHPCPMGLDIALINKYHDLSLLGDDLAKDHYHHLEKKASACVQCGHCNHRCPFHVDQMQRMEEIALYFGE